MHATAIRHVPFEDLGGSEDVLTARGFDLRYAEAGIALPDDDPDLLVVLGGPIGAYEEDGLSLPGRRNPACGGPAGRGQTDARHLPGLPDHGPRAGRAGLSVRGQGNRLVAADPDRSRDAIAADPNLDGEATDVLHWHGDTFDLPDGAVLLASDAGLPPPGLRRGEHGARAAIPRRGDGTGA